MADPNDIVTNVEFNEKDVSDLKKAHYDGGGATRSPAPVQEIRHGLNPALMQMLAFGKNFNQFQGIDRCIRVLDNGTPNQRHCMAMMVKDMTRNMVVCSSCDRIKDVNAHPKTINSSMIKLSPKELEEFHMAKDPLENVTPALPIKKAKIVKKDTPTPRRHRMAIPNTVKIEVTVEALKNDPNVVSVLLQKTLDAILDLPIKNFKEAESLREVKEKVESYLKNCI